MKGFRVKIYLLGAVFFVLSQTGHGQNLDDYLKIAGENNPLVKSAFDEYLAAIERIPQVGTLPDPQAAFAFFLQPVETRVGPQIFKVSISQMFPWMKTLGAQKDVAAALAKAKYEEFEALKNDLFFEVKREWFKIYLLEKEILITRENAEYLQSHENLALRKFEAAKASLADVIRARLNRKELEARLLFLEESRRPLIAGFNFLLNRNPEDLVVFPDSLGVPETYMILTRDSLLKNPEIMALLAKETAMRQQIVVAGKLGMPNLGVGLDYVFVGPRKDMVVPDNGKDVVMPMVSVSLPIYRGKYSAMRNEAKLMEQSVRNRQISVYNHLYENYLTAQRDFEDSKRRMILYRELSSESVQALGILVSSYESGGKDFEDILKIQASILKYQFEFHKAIADLNSSKAKMDYLMAVN